LTLTIIFLSNNANSDTNAPLKPFNITYPTAIEYLKIPQNSINHDFRIENGDIVELIDGKWIANKNDAVLKAVKNISSGEGVFILGSPAVIKQQATLDVSSINQDRLPVRGAKINDGVFLVREERVKDNNDFIPEFTIYKYDKSILEISKFRLKENPYNLSLENMWPLNSDMAAIVLKSNRNPYINTLLIYDIKRQCIVGMREFSEIAFNPETYSLLTVDSLPNSSNIKDALVAFRKRATSYTVQPNKPIPVGLSDLSSLIIIR